MQLMPATNVFCIPDAFDPAENIEGGTLPGRFADEFDGDITLATAAYNAGPGAVEKYGGVPPYDETREYVRRVGILQKRYSEALN
jgi:soluble lytic murein transglycosylase-like protein